MSKNENKKTKNSEIMGIVSGNIGEANTTYRMDKYSTPKGHGFAAEDANFISDKIENLDFFGQGKVQAVGEEIDPETHKIIKNGHDRILNNNRIQTKYCKSGSDCISEYFNSDGYRY